MIQSKEGLSVKDNELVWEVGVTLTGEYKPTRTRVKDASSNFWLDYNKCRRRCSHLNKIEKS